jgi:hypothetical protein
MAVKKKSRIAEHLNIARRYVRSVDIVRDLHDPHALDGYIITPSGRDALRRILNGLMPTSTQRAYRVTGPYGSGKSAFGLLLARTFLERRGRKNSAARLIQQARIDEDPGRLPLYLPLVLNGRRVAFADALLQCVREAASGDKQGIRSKAIVRAADALQKERRQTVRDDARVLALLSKYADVVSAAAGGRGGILLLIDEMGRFLEHAALNRGSEDPAIFQHLAELAGGSGGAPLAVVAILHHRFADYVAGFGGWAEAEWTRSAERYEDVPFHESTEQTTFLLAHALEHSPDVRKLTATRARELYKEGSARGLFATAAGEIAEVAPSLYPLHPAVVACLSNLARRFGQNQRSTFGFLQSLEAFGFQRFIHQQECDRAIWYRLSDLFDYIAAQGTIRPQSPDRERRWDLLLDGIVQAERAVPGDLAVFKCAGLLSVFEPVPGLKADASTIAWCMGLRAKEAQDALQRLADSNLLYRRPHRDDYNLWASTSVDLDGWLERAKTQVPPVVRLDDMLAQLPQPRPLVAHRHYHQTGNLRAFEVKLWNGDGAPAPSGQAEYDGSVFVVPVHPDEKMGDVLAAVSSAAKKASPLALFCLRKITPRDLATAREVLIWRWVESNCKELRADDFARREVQTRLAGVQHRLHDSLAPFVNPSTGDAAEWIHRGRKLEIGTKRSLSQKLSDLCDEMYERSPLLKNELINRGKLSSAAASARMRLLELMVEDADQEYLGLDGAPPERTIYLSVFHASKIHRKVGGRWQFGPPSPDPLRWTPVWKEIESRLEEGTSISFDQLIEHLAKPPWGLRAGPALLVVAAFMTHRRADVALMERNSFQPDLTGAHFQRLAKTPANFALKYLKRARTTSGFLQALSSGLALWPMERPEALVKPIVEAMYAWWNSLSTYALETGSVSPLARNMRIAFKKANEPIEFLYRSLPLACGMDGAPGDGSFDVGGFLERFNVGLQELIDAEPRLRAQAEAAVLDSFGVGSLTELRRQIRTDYEPHRLHLTDYRLRAFVDRAGTDNMADHAWLDSIAGLLSGRRLQEWQDSSLDQFQFEVRTVARRMARWLSLARSNVATSVPLVSIHVVDMGGQEQTVVVRRGDRSRSRSEKADKIRGVLGTNPDAAEILGQLIVEYLSTAPSKDRVHE